MEKSTSTTSLASDKSLRPFLASTFDPASYLNSVLPAWTPSTTSPASTSQGSYTTSKSDHQSLAELNSQTQSLVSQLNAQLSRLSTTLTKLTDEILRCGGRLGYEVEVLRGEAGSLTDTLAESLKDDIAKFVPRGLPLLEAHGQDESSGRVRGASLSSRNAEQEAESGDAESSLRASGEHKGEAEKSEVSAPEYIQKLRVLSTVRDRLDAVIKIFGGATEWVIQPSEVSLKSSFISVSGPDVAGEDNEETREAKGNEFSDRVRREIVELVSRDESFQKDGEAEGSNIRRALERIEEFRKLALVWKDTSEEKARLKFVEGLVKLVEETKKSKGSKDMGYRLRTESRPRMGSSSGRR
ncbi:MAG: hypothetical protein M1831_003770 [Alyxoria varia]|nr:MAG: hypothetical protein M1831_003770 [Alyxoria varia]